jgi:hypothetical protein
MSTGYIRKEPMQGWYCTIQMDTDPRIEEGRPRSRRVDDGLHWCSIQLPRGMLPDQLEGRGLINVTQTVCGLTYECYAEYKKIIWEKRDTSPEHGICILKNGYDYAFDKDGLGIPVDNYQ